MCEYYEINAKQYAKETFSTDMSEQYTRFLPLLGSRQGFLMWEAAAGVMRAIFKKGISGDRIGTVKEPLQRNLESVLRRNCLF